MIGGGVEIDRVDEDLTGVAEIGDSGREVEVREGDALVVPTLDSESLQWFEAIEGGVLEVTVQQRLPGPTDLGEAAFVVEEW